MYRIVPNIVVLNFLSFPTFSFLEISHKHFYVILGNKNDSKAIKDLRRREAWMKEHTEKKESRGKMLASSKNTSGEFKR